MSQEVINLTTYYYKKTEIDSLLNNKMDKVLLATVATSGSYNDLKDKPSAVNVVDVIEDNNLNAISSNAVYDALQNIYTYKAVQIFKQDNEIIMSQGAASNNIGNKRFNFFLEREDDIYISCLVKQTSSGRWYRSGLVVSTEEPVPFTSNSTTNGGSVLFCVGAGDNTFYDSSTQNRFFGVSNHIDDKIVADKWYKFEVLHIGNILRSIITDVENDTIILNQTRTYPSGYKFWSYYLFEQGNITFKDVFIGVPLVSTAVYDSLSDLETRISSLEEKIG